MKIFEPFKLISPKLRFFSTKTLKLRPPLNSTAIESSESKDKRGEKLRLNGGQIEQYKKQLYDLIKLRRDPEQIHQLTRFLLDSCEPSLHLFNVVLKGQLMIKNVEGIKETLLLIAKNRLAFNAVTLNLLLVYYRDLDMMEEAEKLFQAMENRKKDENPLINCAGPNLSAYTTMIAGWARRGDYGRAKKYYEEISAEGADLRPDEQAKCALLNAAVSTGHLEDAKAIFESIEGEKGFVALKLWLRATLQLGGFEETFKTVSQRKEIDSLELSEIIRWILSDLKGHREEQRALIYFIKSALESGIRIGDPQCLHSALDSLKRAPKSLNEITEISVKWSGKLLPVIGGRLLHQLVANGEIEAATKVVKECEKLRIRIPSGLLIDFSALIKNK